MKPIQDFKDYYATEDGEIWSCRPSKRLGSALRKLKQARNKGTGYMQLNMYRASGPRRVDVHRVIATTFIPNPLQKAYVNHKDGNKSNNAVANLEWSTPTENARHAHAAGLMENACGRLTEEDVLWARTASKAGVKQDHIGHVLKVSQSEVSRIVRGVHYKRIKAA
jgi:hypothetical protein